MDNTMLVEIDRRAMLLGITLSELSRQAGVSSATMARMTKRPSAVRPRSFSKLLNALDAIEREKGA